MKHLFLVLLVLAGCATPPPLPEKETVATLRRFETYCSKIHEAYTRELQQGDENGVDCQIRLIGADSPIRLLHLSFATQKDQLLQSRPIAELVRNWCSLNKAVGAEARYSWEFRKEQFRRLEVCTPLKEKVEKEKKRNEWEKKKQFSQTSRR